MSGREKEQRMRRVAWVFLVAVSATGCSSSDDDSTPVHVKIDGASSIAGEQDQGACASHSLVFTGSAKAGATCGNATDCAPSCCACKAGTKGWSAAACVDGVCAEAAVACERSTDDGRYCN
jgi:hypothetical protein